jgi:hypothetical protein
MAQRISRHISLDSVSLTTEQLMPWKRLIMELALKAEGALRIWSAPYTISSHSSQQQLVGIHLDCP